jgi:hypothetical protein
MASILSNTYVNLRIAENFVSCVRLGAFLFFAPQQDRATLISLPIIDGPTYKSKMADKSAVNQFLIPSISPDDQRCRREELLYRSIKLVLNHGVVGLDT